MSIESRFSGRSEDQVVPPRPVYQQSGWMTGVDSVSGSSEEGEGKEACSGVGGENI